MCLICDNLANVQTVKCIYCQNTFCSECLENNKFACPYCSVSVNADPVDLELARLPDTRLAIDCEKVDVSSICSDETVVKCSSCDLSFSEGHDCESARVIRDISRKCPKCFTRIEKSTEDCGQIYCTICSTAWSWKTGKIIKSVFDIHNPLFYQTKSRDKIRFVNAAEDRLAHKIYKSLKTLDRAFEFFNTALFENRIAYIGERITFEQFKLYIREIYKAYDRDVKIKNLLETVLTRIDEAEIYHDQLVNIDDKYSLKIPVKLPYC
jgi:hypothetical protein